MGVLPGMTNDYFIDENTQKRYWNHCRTCGAENGGACLKLDGRPMRLYHAARLVKQTRGQGELPFDLGRVTWA